MEEKIAFTTLYQTNYDIDETEKHMYPYNIITNNKEDNGEIEVTYEQNQNNKTISIRGLGGKVLHSSFTMNDTIATDVTTMRDTNILCWTKFSNSRMHQDDDIIGEEKNDHSVLGVLSSSSIIRILDVYPDNKNNISSDCCIPLPFEAQGIFCISIQKENEYYNGLIVQCCASADDDVHNGDNIFEMEDGLLSPTTPDRRYKACGNNDKHHGLLIDTSNNNDMIEVPTSPLTPVFLTKEIPSKEIPPTLFSLCDILDEVRPISFQDNYFSDTCEQILFIKNEICVSYHVALKRHAVWRIEFASMPPESKPLWKRGSSVEDDKMLHSHLSFVLLWDELNIPDKVPLSKANNIFFASGIKDYVTDPSAYLLCVVSPISNQDIDTRNKKLLRCFSISNDYSIQHVMDKYCISAQPIECFPGTTTDIIVCSYDDGEVPILSLYRGNMHITDCALLPSQDNNMNHDILHNIIEMKHPLSNRIDFICKSSSQTIQLRAYLSFNLNQSPITESLLSCIDSNDIIPLEIKLLLRVKCIQLLQKPIVTNKYDIAWYYLCTLLYSIWDNAFCKVRMNETKEDEISSWEYLVSSEYHTNYSNEFSLFFHDTPKPKQPSKDYTGIYFPNIVDKEILTAIFDTIHLFYEECKLHTTRYEYSNQIGLLLYTLVRKYGSMNDFLFHYQRDCNTCYYKLHCDDDDDIKEKYRFTSFDRPPCILSYLDAIIKYGPCSTTFYDMDISKLNFKSIQKLIKLYAIIFQNTSNQQNQDYLLVSEMVELEINDDFLDDLPLGVVLPIREALLRCRYNPSKDWDVDGYNLIGRNDLAKMMDYKPSSTFTKANSLKPTGFTSKNIDPNNDADKDGLIALQHFSSMLFPNDHRIKEAGRLLRSSRPCYLSVPRAVEVSDHDYERLKQERLLLLCRRSLALSCGRGMLTFNTMIPVLAEPMPIPEISLAGRIPPSNATLALDVTNCPVDMTTWPEFHNGVAAGLRLALKEDIARTWIVYNQSAQGTKNGHGGLLMALGLRGHLKSLRTTDVYQYLTQEDVTTTVGIFLGMSASKRGSCDPNISKMLCLYLPSLLPQSFTTIESPSATQSAAIASIGLLYQGSSHRLMTEFLLSEMGKRPSSDQSTQDRESYSLSCGFALGMINLSYTSAGLADLNIEERLYRYIIGGYDKTDAEEHYKISQGDFINIDITAPGAIVALGLMYLKSENVSVASRLELPDTDFLLDGVRPDLLMLRVISKSLILWDEVDGSVNWVEGCIPDFVKQRFRRIEVDTAKASGMEIEEDEEYNITTFDRQAIKQAHAYITAGACFAIGLRFAGTADSRAASTITHYVKAFKKLRDDMDPITFALRPERPIVEMCLVSSAVALTMVMAGTGDLDAFRLLRVLRDKVLEDYVRYGTHMGLGMAIGLLFLGGGSCTLGTDKEDIAALLMALFPRFPSHTSDNLYHLQALRHCYVLAVKYRKMEAVDVDTDEPVHVPLEVILKDGSVEKWTTPCIIPCDIQKLSIDSDLFFALVMNRGFGSRNHFDCLPLLVKKRPSTDTNFELENFKSDLSIFSNTQKRNNFTSALLQAVGTFQNKYYQINTFLQQRHIHTNEVALQYHLILHNHIKTMKYNRWSSSNIWDVRLISSYYNLPCDRDRKSSISKATFNYFAEDFVMEMQERIDQFFACRGMDGETILACRNTTDPFCSNDKLGLLGCFFIWLELDVPNTM